MDRLLTKVRLRRLTKYKYKWETCIEFTVEETL